MFTTDSKTELYLRQLGIRFEYRESVSFDEFRSDWHAINYGRPESMARVDEAIANYAEMMTSGSAAPAIILHVRGGGFDVLDGVQRSLAAQRAGYGHVAAYICKCDDKTASKIRKAANLRLQGSAPVNPDWAIPELVQEFMIDGNDTAQEIALACGRSLSEIERWFKRLTAKNRISALFTGKTAPTLKASVYDCIALESIAEDFSEAGDEIKELVSVIDKCKFANGDAIRLVSTFFSPKRIGSKKRCVQFRSKLREITQDPVVQGKLQGKRQLDSISRIDTKLKALHTVLKEHKKGGTKFDDVEVTRSWDTTYREIGRLLREQCSTEVRHRLNPFSS